MDNISIISNREIADEFAQKGTVKHFALRLGFLPRDEAGAEAILRSIVEENERRQLEIERLTAKLKGYENER